MNILDIPKPGQENGAKERPENGETGETQLDVSNRDEADERDPAQDELREVLEDYYWLKETSECVKHLVDRCTDYYEYLSATGKMALFRLCFEQWVKGLTTLGSVSRGGTEGELLNLPINEFRNIGMHVVSMTTEEKLAFEPQPVNNDYSTAAQVTLSKGILADYAKNKGMQRAVDRAAEFAWIFGEGSTLKLWKENIGDLKLVDLEEQKIYRKGDIVFITVNPTNLVRDVHVGNFDDNDWFIVRLFVNKYDLAAQYPEKAREIADKRVSTDWDNSRITAAQGEKTNLIPLYLAFHRPTSALPFGRQLFFLDSETWLEDGHLKYREIPIYTNMPDPIESINHGYTTSFDLLPLQQILDIIDTGCATNLTNFLVSNILVPDGCNLGVADIIGSMNLLKYSATAGKPEALNLVEFPPEAQPFRQMIVQRMEVLAGINSTTRGQTDEKITSGTMAALYASQAIHFNSKFQKSYADHAGRLATAVLHDLQDHPEDKRTGLVVGKGNRAYMKEFYGKDVNSIDRVIVQLGSAFAQTDAGKLQMAQDLLASPSGLNAREYLEVVETGALEPLTEGPHRELMQIKEENERLMDGMPCKAIISDDHPTHIKEHKSVAADPELRMSNDPKAVSVLNNVLTHIAEHEKLMQQCLATRPILAGIVGYGGGGPPPTPTKPGATPPPKPAAKPAPPMRAAQAPPPKPAPAAPKRPAVPQRRLPTKGKAAPAGPGPSVGIPQPAGAPAAAPHG